MDPRGALQRLIEERGEDYASLSRLIGRNRAYVQQYIKRGVPKRLAEEDRRLLARYFNVPDALLGGPPGMVPGGAGRSDGDLVVVPRLDVEAAAGAGALGGDESARTQFAFDQKWLRALVQGDTQRLSIIRVEGDSMVPNLADGDEILVDCSGVSERLRDGIYVLRIDDALIVKRLALNPSSRRVSIKSDNRAYPTWPECELSSIDIIGRVVWAGRRIA
ncbi:MAG: peptidase [Alphaproteobacteria bacterium]|nr:peptidase [Alphaproteobacteria bacterium]